MAASSLAFIGGRRVERRPPLQAVVPRTLSVVFVGHHQGDKKREPAIGFVRRPFHRPMAPSFLSRELMFTRAPCPSRGGRGPSENADVGEFDP